jgi:hypothetical protein
MHIRSLFVSIFVMFALLLTLVPVPVLRASCGQVMRHTEGSVLLASDSGSSDAHRAQESKNVVRTYAGNQEDEWLAVVVPAFCSGCMCGCMYGWHKLCRCCVARVCLCVCDVLSARTEALARVATSWSRRSRRTWRSSPRSWPPRRLVSNPLSNCSSMLCVPPLQCQGSASLSSSEGVWTWLQNKTVCMSAG